MEIDRDVLLADVKMVLPAVAKKELFDQADKIAFVGGSLASYNDIVSIIHPISGGLSIEGSIDGRKFYDLLAKMDNKPIAIAVSDNTIEFASGRIKAAFNFSPVNLPIGEIDTSGNSVLLPNHFVEHLEWLSGSCAQDMSRPTLTCIYLSGNLMQSSDGYRATKVEIDSGEKLPDLLLPLAAAEVLVDYEITKVAVGKGKEWARFETDSGTVIYCRISTGTYPDLSAIYDVTGDEIHLTGALKDVLDRARVFAKREHKIDEEVKITLNPRQIIVEASYDGGKFRETIRSSNESSSAVFTIHPDFLATALESGTSCLLSKTRIKFTGPNWTHVIALR